MSTSGCRHTLIAGIGLQAVGHSTQVEPENFSSYIWEKPGIFVGFDHGFWKSYGITLQNIKTSHSK